MKNSDDLTKLKSENFLIFLFKKNRCLKEKKIGIHRSELQKLCTQEIFRLEDYIEDL